MLKRASLINILYGDDAMDFCQYTSCVLETLQLLQMPMGNAIQGFLQKIRTSGGFFAPEFQELYYLRSEPFVDGEWSNYKSSIFYAVTTAGPIHGINLPCLEPDQLDGLRLNRWQSLSRQKVQDFIYSFLVPHRRGEDGRDLVRAGFLVIRASHRYSEQAVLSWLLSNQIGSAFGLLVNTLLEKNTLQRRSLLCPLTGVLNGRGYDMLGTKVMELVSVTDNEEPYWLAMIDLNDFGQINNTYGHPVGDAVLQKFVELILSSQSVLKNFFANESEQNTWISSLMELFYGADSFSIPARIAGDEFVCLMRGDKKRLTTWWNEVYLLFHQAFKDQYPGLMPTFSVGMVRLRSDGMFKDIVQMGQYFYQIADEALYQVKRFGACEVSSSGMVRFFQRVRYRIDSALRGKKYGLRIVDHVGVSVFDKVLSE